MVSHTAVDLGHGPGVAGFARTVAELAVYPERLEVRLLRTGVVPAQTADVAYLPVGPAAQ